MIRGFTVLMIVLVLVTSFTLHTAAAPLGELSSANSTFFTQGGVEGAEVIAPASMMDQMAKAFYKAAKAIAWIWAQEPQVSIDRRADVVFDY